MQDVQIRKATPADKEAVLDICDDVYGGRDYLPAFYDNFMTSPFTTSFLVLYKGKIVSVVSLYFVCYKCDSVFHIIIKKNILEGIMLNIKYTGKYDI